MSERKAGTLRNLFRGLTKQLTSSTRGVLWARQGESRPPPRMSKIDRSKSSDLCGFARIQPKSHVDSRIRLGQPPTLLLLSVVGIAFVRNRGRSSCAVDELGNLKKPLFSYMCNRSRYPPRSATLFQTRSQAHDNCVVAFDRIARSEAARQQLDAARPESRWSPR